MRAATPLSPGHDAPRVGLHGSTFEIGEYGDALFLVMEYIAAETLHPRLEHGRLPRFDAPRVAGEIA